MKKLLILGMALVLWGCSQAPFPYAQTHTHYATAADVQRRDKPSIILVGERTQDAVTKGDEQ